MTPAGKAELWRMVALALALGSIAAIALDYRGVACLTLALSFLSGELYRWFVDRKWDAIAAERAKERQP